MKKTLEYIALGKLIVQFEMKEVSFSTDQASLYAGPTDPLDFADNIGKLLADEETLPCIGEFGRKRVENDLAWTFEVPKLLAAYEQVLG